MPHVCIALAAEPEAPHHARRALEELGGGLEPGERRTLDLVASELVTNSVRHSGAEPRDEIRLGVRVEPSVVRVVVEDPGSGFDAAGRAPEPGSLGGWGLLLVSELVDRWWVEAEPHTRVVCELDR